ncbi:MAG: SAF domain-containing protein, partial [Candidatus Omnitrophica bacterium]|nr:SAF domain-containing protein [Candidatus Omnitrophota bacterium]
MIHIERKVAIIVAAVLGLAAVLLTNMYFRQREAQFSVSTKPVLVAAKEISQNAVIDYGMLAFKTVPVKFIQPGALRARELAVGKTAIVKIMAGEQVLR